MDQQIYYVQSGLLLQINHLSTHNTYIYKLLVVLFHIIFCRRRFFVLVLLRLCIADDNQMTTEEEEEGHSNTTVQSYTKQSNQKIISLQDVSLTTVNKQFHEEWPIDDQSSQKICTKFEL